MFSIPGLIGLIVLTYIRPQAFLVELQGVPIVHLVYLVAAVGFAIDLRSRLLSPTAAPLLGWSIAYYVWSILTLAVARPGELNAVLPATVVRFLLFFMTAQAVQSFRAVRVAVVSLVLISLFLAGVGIHQGLAPKGCFMSRASPTATFDGRLCEERDECARGGEPGAQYRCENVGLFGTYSINGRVRWLGVIEDPNELAMCVSLCIPLLIGLYLLRPGWRTGIVLVGGTAAFILCTVYTQSRGGQLVFLAAIGVYFIRRYGLRGAIFCGVIALPVLLLGGRSGEDADESKMERLEALYTAAELIVQRPIFGVGYWQFTEYHVRTAHNSYALSGAELGLPGLFLFLAVFYQSLKAFWLVMQRYGPTGPARPAYIWAGALSAAQIGLMTGVFFLSFNSSPILWTFLGVCSGFQLAVKRHDPSMSFSLRGRDYAIIAAATIALTAFMYVYSHREVGAH